MSATEPCKACKVRRRAGFDGQCPACAKERARIEGEALRAARSSNASPPSSDDRALLAQLTAVFASWRSWVIVTADTAEEISPRIAAEAVVGALRSRR